MHFVKAKGILSSSNRTNLYRGCSHGCIYCDSRSKCYQMDHDFEDIEVKENAPELLEKALKSKRKKVMIGTGSMSDSYQHCEKKLGLTRKFLELIDRYEFGASVITKSDLVMRDIDLFDSINRKAKSVLQMSLTISDDKLSKIIEPNVCTTTRRYQVLKEFQKRNIPTVVWMSPFLPFLTDTEENLRTILDYCIDAGVKGIICFGIGMTLRAGDREYYYRALDKNFPGLSVEYMKRYGDAYEVNSPDNVRLMKIFNSVCEKYKIIHTPNECFRYLSEMPERQMSLFDN